MKELINQLEILINLMFKDQNNLLENYPEQYKYCYDEDCIMLLKEQFIAGYRLSLSNDQIDYIYNI